MKLRSGLMLAAIVTGCADTSGPVAPLPTRLAVLMLDADRKVLHMGDTATVIAFRLDRMGLPIAPDTARFVWSSSDTTVLTVSANGLVTMLGLGSADVIVQLRDSGALGGPSTTDTASARLTLSATYTVVDPGPVLAAFTGDVYDAQCVIRPGGQAFCRGNNFYGQLGNGTKTSSFDWTPVSGGHSFVSITGGSRHTCALTGDQRGFCWGRGHHGQLGNGRRTPTEVTTPLEIPNHRWLSLEAGGHGATCGIRAVDSVAYCWGHNDWGQVGRSPRNSSDTVVGPVDGARQMRAIYTRNFYACGVDLEGAVYCSGGAGPPTNTPSSGEIVFTPNRIGGTTALVSISVGGWHGCGLTVEGAAHCWGWNDRGELGTGDSLSSGSTRPVVGGLSFRSIYARGDPATCGITADGDVWCWGSNLYGEVLGRSSAQIAKSKVPVKVPLNAKVRWIQSGDETPRAVYAITEANQLICWGRDCGKMVLNSSIAPPLSSSGTRMSSDRMHNAFMH